MAVKINRKIEEKIWAKEFARRLKKRMKELKMKQPELAERTGLTQPTISRYLGSKPLHIPSATNVLRIARVLELDVADLIDF